MSICVCVHVCECMYVSVCACILESMCVSVCEYVCVCARTLMLMQRPEIDVRC